ncbi:MAG: hypothetical protein IH933_05680 [Euryarchaeota archaeon]|jgi:predicted transcriptional regulator|nr:hypothetical protein [Euryarchaeota archaeon]
MTRRSTTDLLTTLNRRWEFIGLVMNGVDTKDELMAELDRSSSSIYKKAAELEATGLLNRTGSTYTPTLLCQLLVQKREEIETLWTHREALSTPLPDEIDPEFFRDAEIVVPGRYAPDRPIDRLKELTENAVRIRGAASITSPRMMETFHRQVTKEGIEIELVLERDLLAHLRTVYPTQFNEVRSISTLNILVADDLPRDLISVATPDGKTVGVSLGKDLMDGGMAFSNSRQGTESIESLYDDYATSAVVFS